MPGLHADLVGAAREPVGEVVVGHDVARPRHRLVVLAAAFAQHHGGVGNRALAVAHDPEVPQRRVAAHELLVDRARVVGVLAAAEAREDHAVLERAVAARDVDLRAQSLLLHLAALVLVEVAADEQLGALLDGRIPSVYGLWRPTCAAAARAGARAKASAGASSPPLRTNSSQVPSPSGSSPASEAIRVGVARALKPAAPSTSGKLWRWSVAAPSARARARRRAGRRRSARARRRRTSARPSRSRAACARRCRRRRRARARARSPDRRAPRRLGRGVGQRDAVAAADAADRQLPDEPVGYSRAGSPTGGPPSAQLAERDRREERPSHARAAEHQRRAPDRAAVALA